MSAHIQQANQTPGDRDPSLSPAAAFQRALVHAEKDPIQFYRATRAYCDSFASPQDVIERLNSIKRELPRDAGQIIDVFIVNYLARAGRLEEFRFRAELIWSELPENPESIDAVQAVTVVFPIAVMMTISEQSKDIESALNRINRVIDVAGTHDLLEHPFVLQIRLVHAYILEDLRRIDEAREEYICLLDVPSVRNLLAIAEKTPALLQGMAADDYDHQKLVSVACTCIIRLNELNGEDPDYPPPSLELVPVLAQGAPAFMCEVIRLRIEDAESRRDTAALRQTLTDADELYNDISTQRIGDPDFLHRSNYVRSAALAAILQVDTGDQSRVNNSALTQRLSQVISELANDPRATTDEIVNCMRLWVKCAVAIDNYALIDPQRFEISDRNTLGFCLFHIALALREYDPEMLSLAHRVFGRAFSLLDRETHGLTNLEIARRCCQTAVTEVGRERWAQATSRLAQEFGDQELSVAYTVLRACALFELGRLGDFSDVYGGNIVAISEHPRARVFHEILLPRFVYACVKARDYTTARQFLTEFLDGFPEQASTANGKLESLVDGFNAHFDGKSDESRKMPWDLVDPDTKV